MKRLALFLVLAGCGDFLPANKSDKKDAPSPASPTAQPTPAPAGPASPAGPNSQTGGESWRFDGKACVAIAPCKAADCSTSKVQCEEQLVCCPQAHTYRETDKACVPASGAPCDGNGSGCPVDASKQLCANGGTAVAQHVETASKPPFAADCVVAGERKNECVKTVKGAFESRDPNFDKQACWLRDGEMIVDAASCEKSQATYSCQIFSGVERPADHCAKGTDETKCAAIAGCKWLPSDYSGPYAP